MGSTKNQRYAQRHWGIELPPFSKFTVSFIFTPSLFAVIRSWLYKQQLNKQTIHWPLRAAPYLEYYVDFSLHQASFILRLKRKTKKVADGLFSLQNPDFMFSLIHLKPCRPPWNRGYTPRKTECSSDSGSSCPLLADPQRAQITGTLSPLLSPLLSI